MVWDWIDSVDRGANDWKKEGASRFTHWPSPFGNMVKDMNQLSCEQIWQMRVKFIAANVADWAFSAFVPSPVELTRKWAGGNYKCGFYGVRPPKNRLFSPWHDKQKGIWLLEANKAFMRPIFYFWAASTYFDAMTRWTSFIYKGQFCEETGHETNLLGGVSTVGSGEADFDGFAGLYTVMYDPNNRYPFGGGTITVEQDGNVNAFACGHITTQEATLTNVQVYMQAGFQKRSVESLGTIPPFTIRPFSVSYSGNIPASEVGPGWSGHVSGGGILPSKMDVERFTAGVGPNQPEWPPDELPKQDLPQYPCLKVYDVIFPSGVS